MRREVSLWLILYRRWASGFLVLAAFSLLFWPKGGLIGHLQHVGQLNERVQREDALKHLYNNERSSKPTSLESLAGALGISTAKAAQLLQGMQEQELLNLSGDGFRLTPTGDGYAVKIIRAHRLWERYLADETGFAEAKWHDLAERYEHQLSPEQVEALSAQLGNPTHDPHGDPIPPTSGEYIDDSGEALAEMPLDTLLQIVHMEDEPAMVYAQLIAEGLHPGMSLRLVEKSPQRIRFIANGEEHVLAPVVAASLSVRQITQSEPVSSCAGSPLCELKPGQSGRVASLSPRLRGAERRRMMDLGILPGTVILAEMTSPAGDPTAYRIRGALVALRREQAGYICVEPIEGNLN